MILTNADRACAPKRYDYNMQILKKQADSCFFLLASWAFSGEIGNYSCNAAPLGV